MNTRNRRLLMINAGVAGAVAAAAWVSIVRPAQARLETAASRLEAMQAEIETHRTSGIDLATIEEKVGVIDGRIAGLNASFYHDDVRADLYAKFTELAQTNGLKLDRINPSEQRGRGDSGVVVLEHTIGFQAAIDRVMTFLDALERSSQLGTIAEIRLRPAPGAESRAELVVEATVMHPVLARPIKAMGVATASAEAGGGS